MEKSKAGGIESMKKSGVEKVKSMMKLEAVGVVSIEKSRVGRSQKLEELKYGEVGRRRSREYGV